MNDTIIKILSLIVWLVISGTIFGVYLQRMRECIGRKGEDKLWMIIACAVVSVPLAVFYKEMLPFYLFGAVLVAYLADLNTGFVLVFCLSLPAGVSSGVNVRFLMIPLIGFVLCMLTAWLDNVKNTIYALICVEAVAAALIICTENFQMDASRTWFLKLLPVCAGILAGTALIGCAYRNYIKKQDVPDAQKAVSLIITQIAESERMEQYSRLISEDTELMRRMKKDAPRLWRHSAKMADIAERAANTIAANALLCKVIAWYMEVGKMEDRKEFIKAGEDMMRKSGMEEELISTIRTVNTKNSPVHCKEAAIVMFAVSISATISFLKVHQENQKISIEKVVENTFQIQLAKGILDDCGLSIKDYNCLKKFYLKEFVFSKNEKVEV